MLELLPDIAPQERAGQAALILAALAHDLPESECAKLTASVLAVMAAASALRGIAGLMG